MFLFCGSVVSTHTQARDWLYCNNGYCKTFVSHDENGDWYMIMWVLGQSCENAIFISFWGRGPSLRDGSKWRLQIVHYFGIRGRVL